MATVSAAETGGGGPRKPPNTTFEIIRFIDFSPVADATTGALIIDNWDTALTADDRFTLERVFWGFYDEAVQKATKKYEHLGYNPRQTWDIAEAELVSHEYLSVEQEDLAAMFDKVQPILKTRGLLEEPARKQPVVVSKEVCQALGWEIADPPRDTGKRAPRNWLSRKRPAEPQAPEPERAQVQIPQPQRPQTAPELIQRVDFTPVDDELFGVLLMTRMRMRFSAEERETVTDALLEYYSRTVARHMVKCVRSGSSEDQAWALAEIEVLKPKHLPGTREDLELLHGKVEPILRAYLW